MEFIDHYKTLVVKNYDLLNIKCDAKDSRKYAKRQKD